MALAEPEVELSSGELVEFRPELCIPEIEGAREADSMQIIYPPVSIINTFAQQRNGRNQRQADLDASIEAKGGRLHYQVDVCSLTESQAQEYIDFTNRIWGAARSVDDFIEYQPGQYLILIAGHSRLQSVKNYADKYGIDPNQQAIKAQLREITSVSDFLDMQVSENIHSSPPTERAARAYAEGYLYETSQNTTLSQSEFCRKKGIRPGALRDALLYAKLPPAIRECTDAGTLPFSISVELGKAVPVLRQEAVRAHEARGVDPKDMLDEIEDEVTSELFRFISLFNGKHKRHIRNTQIFIRHHVDALRKKFADESEAEDLEMSLFDASGFNRSVEVIRTEIGQLPMALINDRGTKQRRLHNDVTKLVALAGLEVDTESEDATVELAKIALSTAITGIGQES